jgi:hypothetical protein
MKLLRDAWILLPAGSSRGLLAVLGVTASGEAAQIAAQMFESAFAQVRREQPMVALHNGRQPAITRIHDVNGALEDRVKENFLQIARVTIHPEPVEER